MSVQPVPAAPVVPVQPAPVASVAPAAAAGSPGAPAPAPAPAPVPKTEAEKINDALNALTTKNNVDKLWKEKVTDANVFTKLFGLISYAWNKSEALEKDKAAIDFSNSASELVKAVSARYLTQQEAGQAGAPGVQVNTLDQRDGFVGNKLIADEKLQGFYAAFKARITQLNVNENSSDFGVYSAAAQKLIDNCGTEAKAKLTKGYDLVLAANLTVKLKTTAQEFNNKIFSDMIGAYANQPIESITIDGFKAKVALVKSYFANVDTVAIESKLRQAIKAKFDTVQFDTIRGAFSDQNPNNAKVVEIKTALQTKLTAEKTALDAELAAMRGTNGGNGTIHTAHSTRATAQTARDTARNEYVVVRSGFVAGANAQTPVSELLNLPDADPRIIEKKAALKVAEEAFLAADKAHADLVARFNQIAVYTGENITGGKLAEVNANLAEPGLTTAARNEANKIASFYGELQQVVGDVNAIDRSRALNRIIG